MKIKEVLKVIFITVFSALIFFSVSYFYLNRNLNTEVRKEEKSIPYSYVPKKQEFTFCYQGISCLISLDFKNSKISADFISNKTALHRIDADRICFAKIIDRIGGIDLIMGGEKLRYTGVQVVELIEKSKDSNTLKSVTEEIFKKISKNGFSNEDFAYIIESGCTNYVLPDVYYWQDYSKKLCKNYEVII